MTIARKEVFLKKSTRFPGLTAGILLLLALLVPAGTVFARNAVPYDRSQMLGPEGFLSALPRVGDSAATPDPKAWQKINGVVYNGSGVAIPGAILRGIDVSAWQMDIDWSKVARSNVDFAFVRIAHGVTILDSKFRANMSGANAAGVPVGCYVYSIAKNAEDAIREAQLAIRMMKGYKVSYPVVFDMEDSSQMSLGKKKITEIVIAFTDEIRRAGYYPMLYLNPNWYNYLYDMSKFTHLDLWLAWYGDKLLPPFTAYRYSVWQGTGGEESLGLIPTRGMIDGIHPGLNVDIDIGFVDYTKIVTPRTGPVSTYVPSPVSRNGWYQENGKTYFYRNSAKVYGAQVINGSSYRFSNTDGSLYTDVLLYSSGTGKTCYAGENGALVKNQWVDWKEKRYYIGADGYALTGENKVDGTYYFFDTARGYVTENKLCLSKDGNVYYYGKDGLRYTGGLLKVKVNGETRTYYFNKQGKAYKSWHIIGKKRYYFYGGRDEKTGIRAENTSLLIDGELCVFDRNGVCIRRSRIRK